MQKITPFLWFDKNAEEAMKFYTSIFKHSRVGNVIRYENAGPDRNESVLTGSFFIGDQEFMVLNGGPYFKFNEAISLFVRCKDQEEVDYFWEKLTSDGGQESMCGWLKDKFGLSWQIVPDGLNELLANKDPRKAKRAMDAMMKMRKLNIDEIKQAMNDE